MSSWNTLRATNWLTTPSNPQSYMLKLWHRTSACLMSSKSKKLSLLSVQKRLTKSTISLKTLLKQRKPCIQMTTKGPLRKHIIISMSNDNNTKFMKNSFAYIANINKALRNVKSEILIDFIHSDPLGIMVVTNKVSYQSDFQIIEHYIKNLEDIDILQVDVLHLS